jgi:predicted DNA-binding transcriptional regulator YafY
MPRTQELIRQWQLIREIDGSHGLTIDELAEIGGCTTRTIRRDLKALQSAGFALYDEREGEGPTRWRLLANPLKRLDTSFRITELCALYFSRALLQAAAYPPFDAELASAFARVEAALPNAMRSFIDRLPGVLVAKGARRKLQAAQDPRGVRTSRLMEAALNQREVGLRYASASSGVTREYTIHPYRLAYADGGLYLIAYVPAYQQVRTFALERIESAALLDTKFTRRESLPAEAFADSMGVHTGRPTPVVIDFVPRVSAFVRERQWHTSQLLTERPDGGLRMKLKVCLDAALRSWVLSFGPDARVVSPSALADEIAAAHHAAHARYADIEAVQTPAVSGPVQRQLPFPPGLTGRSSRAAS